MGFKSFKLWYLECSLENRKKKKRKNTQRSCCKFQRNNSLVYLAGHRLLRCSLSCGDLAACGDVEIDQYHCVRLRLAAQDIIYRYRRILQIMPGGTGIITMVRRVFGRSHNNSSFITEYTFCLYSPAKRKFWTGPIFTVIMDLHGCVIIGLRLTNLKSDYWDLHITIYNILSGQTEPKSSSSNKLEILRDCI